MHNVPLPHGLNGQKASQIGYVGIHAILGQMTYRYRVIQRAFNLGALVVEIYQREAFWAI